MMKFQTLTRFILSNRVFSTDAKRLFISESCVKQLKKLATDGQKYLRVTVEGGGCSGFQYKFELDNKIQDDDKVFETDGVGIIIDCLSLDYVSGATVEYHEELIKSAFRITNNPLAETGCSCGASFSIK